MQITIDTSALSETDRAILALLGNGAAPAKAEKKPAAAAAKPAKDFNPDADAQAATLEDAVAAATKLVSNGEAAKVKAALAAVSAKRVSELDEADIPAFLAALDA